VVCRHVSLANYGAAGEKILQNNALVQESSVRWQSSAPPPGPANARSSPSGLAITLGPPILPSPSSIPLYSLQMFGGTSVITVVARVFDEGINEE
jgi:hypothetical protein